MSTLEKILTAGGAELFWESRVAASLGVPRKLMAELRKAHLSEGADFERRENNAVALTEAGLAKIEALIAKGETVGDAKTGAGKPKKTAGKPARDVPSGPPPRELMTVDRVPQNTGLLLCITHTRKAPVRLAIRVKDNTNFAAGMVLEAIESRDGVWQFRNRVPGDESTVGRLPRRKGRW